MLLFLDESGTDHKAAPYEVLGGIAIHERDLWNYVQATHDTQRRCFGGLLRDLAPGWEPKGSSLLGRDKVRLANQEGPLDPGTRQELARDFLLRNSRSERPRRAEFTAFGQACGAYVGEVLETAARFGVKVFASIVDLSAPQPARDEFLRRDYAFLFERYFYYLEEQPTDARGLIVFDELERSQCRRALRRLGDYFLRTQRGRTMSARIIPEPFFVHSDLTTGTQAADLVVYVINWAYRYGPMTAPVRPELEPFADQVRAMIYHTTRPDQDGRSWDLWGVNYTEDLRPASERP
jgi:hypothetical protein